MSTKKNKNKNKKKKELCIADIKDPGKHIAAVSQAHFRVEEMLGRPIKKYNLIISTKQGDHFSSSNNQLDKDIINCIRKADKGDALSWALGWMVKSKEHEEQHGSKPNLKFFCMFNLDDVECENFGKVEAMRFAMYSADWVPLKKNKDMLEMLKKAEQMKKDADQKFREDYIDKCVDDFFDEMVEEGGGGTQALHDAHDAWVKMGGVEEGIPDE